MENDEQKQCPRCATKNPSSAEFCSKCRTNLSSSQSMTTAEKIVIPISALGLIVAIYSATFPLGIVPLSPDVSLKVSIWLAIVSLAALVILILISFKVRRKNRTDWRHAMIAFFGTAVIAFIVLAFFYSPPAGPIDVHITSPAENGTVGLRYFVQGTSTNMTSDKELWIVLEPYNMTTRYYYPQNYTTTIYADGSWSSEVYFGQNQTKGIGEKFDIIPVVADANAQARFNAYLTESAQKKSWDGRPNLPDGATQYHPVTVTRESSALS